MQVTTQQQESAQLLERQHMLHQLDGAFEVIVNYFKALRSGDERKMLGQNILATTSMNALQSRARLAKLSKDSDVLLMCLVKTFQFESTFDYEFGDLDGFPADIKQSFFGFMRAVLTGQKVPQLAAASMDEEDSEAVNSTFGKLLQSTHSVNDFEEEVRRNPGEYEVHQSQLLAASHSLNLSEIDTRFNPSMMTLHYEGRDTVTAEKPFRGSAVIRVDEWGEPDLMEQDEPAPVLMSGQVGRVQTERGWQDVYITKVDGTQVVFQFEHDRREYGPEVATRWETSSDRIDLSV